MNCRMSIHDCFLHGILFSAVLLCGCTNGNPLNRQQISGQVTLDGNPLEQGIVEFSPQQPGGVSSGTAIKDGRYVIEADKGLPPGNYLVRLYSSSTGGDGSASPAGTGMPGPSPRGATTVARERIPSQYNTASKLIVEVKEGESNTFDFQINTKGKMNR